MTERFNPNHLPVDHPEYRYPPSPNPYWTKAQALQPHVWVDGAGESNAGRWRAIAGLQSQCLLTVEIGSNYGHVLLEWAAQNPEGLFIGLDWKFKGIHRSGEKARNRNLDNALFIRAHAERMHFLFAPSEIDHLKIFFPDPWPKKSQMKNRFLTAERFAILRKLVKSGGTLEIKTDHVGYFAWIEDAIQNTEPERWKVLERSDDLHAGNPQAPRLTFPEVTLFEKGFIAKGQPIHRVLLQAI